jgi:hypothetical protein
VNGLLTIVDCLQQATADQAFTNAKAAGDANGMTFALIYRALERNTGSVGLASVPCESIKAVNPEIAAIQQHQDPAGEGAQALNKQIATDLAAQIAAVGGDPALANEASTFAPGELGDNTGAGNTCDDDADDAGCINTLGLRVDDLSDAEIQAAAGGAGAAGAAAAGGAAANATAVADAGAAADAGNGKAAGKAGKADGKKAKAAKADAAKADAAADAAPACSARKTRRMTRRQAAGGADFGSCADASIVFGIPSDGRQEDAFEAADLTNFPHGSALNIGVISSFICDQLVNKCDANQAAVTQCDTADAASKGLKGQAAADAFNKAIGA